MKFPIGILTRNTLREIMAKEYERGIKMGEAREVARANLNTNKGFIMGNPFRKEFSDRWR